MNTLTYVSGAEVSIRLTPGGVAVRVNLPDQCVLAAKIKRVFPLSIPNDFLSIQTSDGTEVAVLRGLKDLDDESSQAIAQELDRRYFTPAIERIDALKQEAGMWHFTVLTQRGPTDFYVRNWRDNSQEIAPNRWQILSVDGARYEIMNLEGMDARSRRFMDQLL